MNVLGTPIETAHDDARPRTFVASDLHIPEQGGRAFDGLKSLLAVAAEDAAATRVLLLGDVYDWFVGIRQLRIGRFGEVADAMRAAVDAGVSLTILHGNRDFMLDRHYAKATGVRIVPGGLRLRLGRRDVLALHGDELLLRDEAYLRSKRWLRSGWFTFLLRTMPLSCALFLARGARRSSMKTDRTTMPSRFDPTLTAVDAVSALGVDLLLFGHIHKTSRGVLPGGGEYCVLPAFDDGFVHLRHDVRDGDTIRFFGADGRVLPDPPPRTFDDDRTVTQPE